MAAFAKMGDIIKYRFKEPPMFSKGPGEGVEVFKCPSCLKFWDSRRKTLFFL